MKHALTNFLNEFEKQVSGKSRRLVETYEVVQAIERKNCTCSPSTRAYNECKIRFWKIHSDAFRTTYSLHEHGCALNLVDTKKRNWDGCACRCTASWTILRSIENRAWEVFYGLNPLATMRTSSFRTETRMLRSTSGDLVLPERPVAFCRRVLHWYPLVLIVGIGMRRGRLAVKQNSMAWTHGIRFSHWARQMYGAVQQYGMAGA